MTKANLAHVPYTWKHKIAYLKLEKELRGYNTISGYLHDLDKIFLYIFTPLSIKTIKKIHKNISRHHVDNKNPDYEQAVIDWECCPLTKPDKPENAYETLITKHPECYWQMMPVLLKWKLLTSEQKKEYGKKLLLGNKLTKELEPEVDVVELIKGGK